MHEAQKCVALYLGGKDILNDTLRSHFLLYRDVPSSSGIVLKEGGLNSKILSTLCSVAAGIFGIQVRLLKHAENSDVSFTEQHVRSLIEIAFTSRSFLTFV
ncbi:hypothetical protein D3C72_2274360 [compost metagenome]